MGAGVDDGDMMDGLDIRESRPDEAAAIEAFYPRPFPDEDLVPLVRELLREPAGVLSLVATDGSGIVGHCVFTLCGVDGGPDKVALLGPLGVAPSLQKQGVGSGLVRAGLDRLRGNGVAWVYVLGDPAYYGRFGFAAEAGIAPPYPLPPEWEGAWQSMSLNGAEPPSAGVLAVSPPWRKPALWGP